MKRIDVYKGLDDLEKSTTSAAEWMYEFYTVLCVGQVRPDGENCAICGDIDHQAPECRFNPFVRLKKMIAERR